MINYFKFIIKQLGHMQMSSWLLWLFSLGAQLMIFLDSGDPLNYINVLTFVGTSLGVLTVVAINSTKPINGWFGILSAICFIIIGYHAGNFLSIGEQLAYVATLDIPVLLSSNWSKGVASKIRHFDLKEWIVALIFTVIVWLGSASGIGTLTTDPRPLIDGLSFAICLTAGLACTLRFREQYIWWFASGIAQVILWFVTLKQHDATAGMLVNSSIYVINDILAVTISPWFNKRSKDKMIADEREMSSEL